MIKVGGPILMPFCSSFEDLIEASRIGKRIYLNPLYKFWGEKIKLQTTSSPTMEEVRHLIDKVLEAKYNRRKTSDMNYQMFLEAFNDRKTASTLSLVSKLELTKKERRMIVFAVTSMAEDSSSFDKPTLEDLSIEKLAMFLDRPTRNWLYAGIRDVSSLDISKLFFLDKLGRRKFGSIFDSLPGRQSMLYSYKYLNVVSLLSRRRELISSWDSRLRLVCRDNLLMGSYVVVRKCLSEQDHKLRKTLKDLEFLRIEDNIWLKPEKEAKQRRKKINIFY